MVNDPRLIAEMAADPRTKELVRTFFEVTQPYRYSYNFDWLGVPIIQHPQDVVAVQELIWSIKPEAVVETGVAHGGSLILSASILELLGGDGIVVGVDIDIREHNRKRLETHPLYSRIKLLEGSSIADEIVAEVKQKVAERSPVLVFLDSMHSHAHVLRELELYSDLVAAGSYLVVFDTIIEYLPPGSFPDRPWDVGDSPATAVKEFLSRTDRFVVDQELEDRLLFTVAPGGFLKCVED